MSLNGDKMSKKSKISRRDFMEKTSAITAGDVFANPMSHFLHNHNSAPEH